MTRILILIFCLACLGCPLAIAQARNEIAISYGIGSLQVDPGGGTTAVFSVSYRLHMTRYLSVEGAMDTFNYKFLSGPAGDLSTYKDDYHGVEAALICYFRPNRETGRVLPFIAAGIGKTTTDFTEIPSHPYYRLGAGVAYNLNERFGLRLELRDEIIKRLYQLGEPNGNLPSVRLGIVYRF